MAKTKILIVGAKGMLGSDLVKVFSREKKYTLYKKDKEDLDITDKKSTVNYIKKITPSIIINAAAFTDVEGCEKKETKKICYRVNTEGVKNLAQAAKIANSLLIHFSTDYVFSGKKKTAYKEMDRTIPLNNYGKSKLLGERYVRKYLRKYYIIRTSWLYGKKGKNFVSTMLKLAAKNDNIKVVGDQYGKPTFTVDLAKATNKLLSSRADFGVYHLVNEGVTNWYGLAKEAFRIKKIKIKTSRVKSNEYQQYATRPAYSPLANTKFKKLRPWRNALREYLKSIS